MSKEVFELTKESEVMRQHVLRMLDSSKEFKVTIEPLTKKRTNSQNSAIHVYCDLLGIALNDAGFDMKTVLAKKADTPWTMTAVKEVLWKPLQEAMLGKKSTTGLDTSQVSQVFNVLARHISENFGVYVDFPSNR